MRTISENKKRSRDQIISIVLLIGSIVIGFFFTMDQGYGYIEKKDTLEATKKEASEKKQSLQKLQATVQNIETSVELQSDIERYAGDFREDVIFDSIFTPAKGISIATVSLSKGEKMPNGLSLATISVSLKAQDTNVLGEFLNYLTKSEINKKSYIINSLTFPLDTTKNEAVSVNMELAMYYFE